MIDIKCSQCGQTGEAPDKFQGRTVKCGKCDAAIRVLAPRSSLRWLVLVPVYLLLLGAAGTGAYFIIAPHLAPKEMREQSEADLQPQRDPPPAKEKPAREDAVLPTKKEAEKERARQRVEEEEKAEAERRKQEEAQKALEAKLERERQEKEKIEAERKAKEEQARLLQERRHPKLTAQPEEVDREPGSFYGKRLYFDRVTFREGGLDQVKDLKRFTVGVVSSKGKYFSRVPFNGLFFSVPDKLAATLKEKSIEWETAGYLRLFCEIAKCERKKGKIIPEGRIFKIEVYSKMGNLVHTWEELE